MLASTFNATSPWTVNRVILKIQLLIIKWRGERGKQKLTFLKNKFIKTPRLMQVRFRLMLTVLSYYFLMFVKSQTNSLKNNSENRK